MVAVGLLAPLNMISSAASGEASENKEGFFAQVAAFFKHMNDGIRMATAVVIINNSSISIINELSPSDISFKYVKSIFSIFLLSFDAS
jgi:hypothetical protein